MIAAYGSARAQPAAFADPEQFLVDKETDLVAIVTVTRAEDRWIVLPHGDHIPLVIAHCRMEEVLAGEKGWPVGSVEPAMQVTYNDMIFADLAPPAIPERRYVLWALRSPADGELPAAAPWMAHPQGLLLVRGKGDREFVFWNGKRYGLEALRQRLKTNRQLPLDRIVDPVVRLKVAEDRMERGTILDEKAFVRGLLLNIVDPEGQAKRVERGPGVDPGADLFGMAAADGQPHGLWYTSLALLRDFGKENREGKDAAIGARRRAEVVAALTPVATTARARVRLAAALALADLDSAAGRDALIAGLNSDSGPVSSDPPSDMTYPGRYRFDDSSETACAYALARLGDRRGLKHTKPQVRLAAAEALRNKPDAELTAALEQLAREQEPQVEQLRAKGELTKPRGPGDRTTRYPESWLRTHALLARFGSASSLQRLLDAYVTDFATYPDARRPALPVMQPVVSSMGPTIADAIHASDVSASTLLERLRTLAGDRADWNSPSMQALRESLNDPPAQNAAQPASREPDRAEIAALLADADANRRAEGLAAAGYHQLADLYDKVLDVATRGTGVERDAAIYALGFYNRDLPDDTLRQLLRVNDVRTRLSAAELATRKDPARFARECIDVARSLLKTKNAAERPESDAVPKLLARLARGPIPSVLLDALADPDPVFRRIVIEALALSGNPDAVPALKPLASHPDAATQTAARHAIQVLGPR